MHLHLHHHLEQSPEDLIILFKKNNYKDLYIFNDKQIIFTMFFMTHVQTAFQNKLHTPVIVNKSFQEWNCIKYKY